ncbi:MAG: ribonuclease III [Ruminococcaceae bacterium]|nr:ribonuclease III [Oscillospiraceae bacterium]
MAYVTSVKSLEARLGHTFKDRTLINRALTHSSHSNETGERNHHLLCNERLEFFGDSVLSLVVSRYLYNHYINEPEGDLTCMRKDVVCAPALARYARKIGLGACLLLGVGEDRNGGRDNENILADAFEAVLAALYIDTDYSLDAVADFLLPLVEEDLREYEVKGTDRDYKTPLQQFIQQTEGDHLEYVLIHEEGPDHMKTFEVEARLNSNVIGRGKGRSKRKAEQAAAKDAMALFGVK